MPYEHHHISNHLQLNCLSNSLFRLTIMKISKLHITGPLRKKFTHDQWFPLIKSQYSSAAMMTQVISCRGAHIIAFTIIYGPVLHLSTATWCEVVQGWPQLAKWEWGRGDSGVRGQKSPKIQQLMFSPEWYWTAARWDSMEVTRSFQKSIVYETFPVHIHWELTKTWRWLSHNYENV